MVFRITRVDDENGTLLRVDGQLSLEGLSELEHASEKASTPLTIDLTDLRLADEPSLEALRHLESGGAKLVGASQYLGAAAESRIVKGKS